MNLKIWVKRIAVAPLHPIGGGALTRTSWTGKYSVLPPIANPSRSGSPDSGLGSSRSEQESSSGSSSPEFSAAPLKPSPPRYIRADHIPKSRVQAPPSLSGVSDSLTSLKKMPGFSSDETPVRASLGLKQRDMDNTVVQRPPLPFTVFIDQNPDNLGENVVPIMVKSIRCLREINWGKDTPLEDIDRMKPILEAAILKQTGLAVPLTPKEIKIMMCAALQMKADGCTDAQIEYHLSNAHRGQIIRVITTDPMELGHAYYSGSKDYESVSLSDTEVAALPGVPPALSLPEDLSRVAQALPLTVPERNVRVVYPVPRGSKGYLYARAPGLPEGINPNATHTGGALQFVPCCPDEFQPSKGERVVSGNPRHRLSKKYRVADDKAASDALSKAQAAQKTLAQIVLDKVNSDVRVVKEFESKKMLITRAILAKITKDVCSQDAPEGISTDIIYKATDSVLKQKECLKIFGVDSIEEVPLWAQISLWREVESRISQDTALMRPVVNLVEDIAILAAEAGAYIPIGAQVTKVAEVVGSETVGKLVNMALEKFGRPRQLGVTRYDQDPQIIEAHRARIVKGLDSAVEFLERSLGKAGKMKEKLENAQEKLDGADAGVSTALLKIIGIGTGVGPVLVSLLKAARSAAKLGSAINARIALAPLTKELNQVSLEKTLKEETHA